MEVQLASIYDTYQNRVAQAMADAEGSYTVNLLRDNNKLIKKIGEEFAEFMQAILRIPIDPDEVINEAADLKYAIDLKLVQLGLDPRGVLYEDIRRNQLKGGCDE